MRGRGNLFFRSSSFWHVACDPGRHSGSGLLPAFSDLPYGNDWKDLCEEDIKKREERDAACEDGPLDPGWNVKGSLDGHSLSSQSRNDDDKPFQPHSQNDRDRGDDSSSNGSKFLDGKNGQRNNETEDKVEPEKGCKLSCELRPEDGHMNRVIPINDGDILGKGKIEP